MNPAPPIPGGGFLPGMPIWYPPISANWIASGLIVFAGAVSNRVQPRVRALFTNPIGFFITAAAALYVFQNGFAPMAFAIMFMLLMMWSSHLSENAEGFLCATPTSDWVNNSKRWFVERVLKEHPVAIQDRDVATYPVSGAP